MDWIVNWITGLMFKIKLYHINSIAKQWVEVGHIFEAY